MRAEAGDVFAKAEVRLLEMYESASIIEQCVDALEKMKEGDIALKINEIPQGIGTGRAEAPRGEVFHFVVSDGSSMPPHSESLKSDTLTYKKLEVVPKDWRWMKLFLSHSSQTLKHVGFLRSFSVKL